MYRLLQISGPGTGQAFNLNAFQTVGRNPTSHIPINDPTVSRDHCVIHLQGDILTIVPADAATPILLNGVRVGNCTARVGDVLQFGQSQFQVQSALPVPDTTLRAPTQASYPTAPYATQQPQYPPQSQPMGQPSQGPIQQVTVVQQNNSTGWWVILAVIFAGPLMCVGLLAIALLPFVMVIVGGSLCLWGLVEYLQLHKNPYNQIPSQVYAKMFGGGITAFLGLIWVALAFAHQKA